MGEWTSKEISKCGNVVTGTTPSKKDSSNYSSDDYFFFKPSDLDKGSPITESKNYISKIAFENTRTVPAGAVLVTCIGATIGKTGYVVKPGGFNQQINAFIPDDEIDSKFAYYQIISPAFQHEIIGRASSTTLPILNKSKFSRIPFIYPPLPEQRAIVAKLEELLGALDRSVGELEVALGKLGVYRQSVLREGFGGRLTGGDSEPDKTILGEYITRIHAGKSFKCTERPPTHDEVGVAKVSAVTWGEYNEEESKTTHDPERVNPDYFIKPGDFLISRANTIELVGSCVIVRKVTKSIMLSDKTLRINFEGVLPEFVKYYLRSVTGRREIEDKSTGNQASMRNIGQARLKQIAIPSFSLPEQHQIVAEIESRLSVADALEREIVGALERVKGVRMGVLKRAFGGELLGAEELQGLKAAPSGGGG